MLKLLFDRTTEEGLGELPEGVSEGEELDPEFCERTWR